MSKQDVEIVVCPAEGCEYDGVPQSVAAHYSGKRDENHPGGYQKAQQLLEQESGGTEDQTGSSSPSEAVDTQVTQGPASSDGGTQTASSGGGLSLSGPPEPEPDPEPSASPEPPAEEDEEYVCPACGAPTGQDRAWFERVDVWQCDECGKKWRGVP